MEQVLSLISKLLNLIPERCARFLCSTMGYCIYYGVGARRHVLLRNLHIVFPKKSLKERKKLARLNCGRWVEMVWEFLASSTWSQEKIRQRFSVSPELKTWIESFEKRGHSTVVLVPHLNLMEALTWLPCFFEKFPETGVVYRPFQIKWFETWMRKTRERFNVRLVSRKRGLLPLEKFLKQKGIVSILFDQSAGSVGNLTTFFGRLASTTDLPGRLVEQFKSDLVAIYTKRTGFLKGEICIEEIISDKSTLSVTMEANRWLENKLKTDACFYENWLWLHRRWKTQHWPLRRFNISQKRDWLENTCKYFHWDKLPQKTQAWFRMPNSLKECLAIYPILTAIRKARPDFCMHLVVKSHLAHLLQRYFPVDFIHIVSQKKGLGYFKRFWMIREQYPDIWVNFMTSLCTDLEAFCAGAPQRFGLQTERRRPLLTHTYATQSLENESRAELWYRFAQYFGLKEPLLQTPICKKTLKKKATCFGCCLDSFYSHQNFWPIHFWKNLISQLLNTYSKTTCILLGNNSDRAISEEIASVLPHDRIQNMSGHETFIKLAQTLESVDFVVGHDSDVIHLANFLGTPTVMLPTLHKQTNGLFFQSETCVVPSEGEVSSDSVFDSIQSWLKTKTSD